MSSSYYLVVGSGNIARRHIANIKMLFVDAAVLCVSASGRAVTTEETGADIVCSSLDEALSLTPVFAVVASPSTMHLDQAEKILNWGVPVLIEKPLSDSISTVRARNQLKVFSSTAVEVAYNLRFLPSAIKLKCLLEDRIVGRIHNVIIDVGQYLPDWRPLSNYKNDVSARRDLGGGVLLELSHELDYLVWLFGRFDKVYCIASNSGMLDIDVEDRVEAIFSREDGLIATVHMDYLQRSVSRTCKIIGELGTLKWDLVSNQISLHATQGKEDVLFSDDEYDRNRMYLDELKHFSLVAAGTVKPISTVAQAAYILNMIAAMRMSSNNGCAINIKETL